MKKQLKLVVAGGVIFLLGMLVSSRLRAERLLFEPYYLPKFTEFQNIVFKAKAEVRDSLKQKVEKMIFSGADINAQDEDGYTLLHSAVSIDHAEIVEILLKNGANPNIKDKKDNSPLHFAMRLEASRPVIKLLCENGADLNAQNSIGFTPLHYACILGHLPGLLVFLNDYRDRVKMDIKDKDGNLPRDIEEFLRNHGAK